MAKRPRKGIPKSVRFEVFKRDSFTCQYCGESAPDVILELDHIKPHSQGGDEDVMNLITACKACNAGKSDRTLDDKSVIAKQKAQLDELNERRIQLEMMLEWRQAMADISKIQEDSIAASIDAYGTYSVGPIGRTNLRKWVKKYGFEEVSDAAQTSFDQYIEYNKAGKITPQSWEKAFTYIPRIINVRRQTVSKPYMSDLFYIRGIARNRFKYVNEIECVSLLETAHLAGATIDSLREFCKACHGWADFRDGLETFIEEHGGTED